MQTPRRPFPWLRWIAGAAIVLVVLIQLVPVWAVQQNPPVHSEPDWSNAEAQAIARRACYDCHSNETVWPLYSKIAPVSWLVTYDVVEGREKLNFSEWALGGGKEADDIAETVAEGEMPPRIYTIMHPEAVLSDAERQVLMDAFGGSAELGRRLQP
jgi:cytochrome c551/c552